MSEIILAISGIIFFFFIAWLVCCCWWLNDKETLAERIVKITKQSSRMKWFVVYVVAIMLGILVGVMIRMMLYHPKQEYPKQECPQTFLNELMELSNTYTQLQDKVNNFCKEHKRASICK